MGKCISSNDKQNHTGLKTKSSQIIDFKVKKYHSLDVPMFITENEPDVFKVNRINITPLVKSELELATVKPQSDETEDSEQRMSEIQQKTTKEKQIDNACGDNKNEDLEKARRQEMSLRHKQAIQRILSRSSLIREHYKKINQRLSETHTQIGWVWKSQQIVIGWESEHVHRSDRQHGYKDDTKMEISRIWRVEQIIRVKDHVNQQYS